MVVNKDWKSSGCSVQKREDFKDDLLSSKGMALYPGSQSIIFQETSKDQQEIIFIYSKEIRWTSGGIFSNNKCWNTRTSS